MTEDVVETKENEEVITAIRWKNRRRMAWLSFIFMQAFMFTLTGIYLYLGEYKLITDMASWFFSINGGVILGYMGFTTLGNFFRGK